MFKQGPYFMGHPIYSPTETDCSDSKKDDFYRLLKKACQQNDKCQKLIVAGDFNAKTDLALKKCCYDGKIIVQDENCNTNGTRMKDFCRHNKLCITSTFFDYPLENRYTWYSIDGKTKRVNDYVLMERFVQNFVIDCKAEPDIDFDSDHRILITSLHTPMTRRARWRPRQTQKKPQPDLKALQIPTIENSFLESIDNQLSNDNEAVNRSVVETSEKIVNLLTTVGEATLPRSMRKERVNEIWKNDKEFNRLLNERRNHKFGSNKYKMFTRKIKIRIKHLRNEKLKREAEDINENTSRRKIEELYRQMKTDTMTLKNL